jgi:leader peptidase (prepilin peptidase)/N-methyltransferase
LGLGWGSFSTMAVYRIPRGMPWVGDKPRCLMCKHELNIIDYFSIISYFIWNGTCRYCKGKFECNIGYFFTEFFITLGFLLLYMKYGFGDIFVLLTLLIVACSIMAVVDCEHKRIPAKMLISTLLIGALYRTFLDHTFYGALYGLK